MASSSDSFNPFAPGFDFLQRLGQAGKGGGTSFPSWGEWAAPTVSVEELDKRIGELKTVLFWLEQNQRALMATIQAMEVQKMTLSTLQTMNVPMDNWAQSMVQHWQKFAQGTTQTEPAAAAKQPPAPEPAPPVAAPAASAEPPASAPATAAAATAAAATAAAASAAAASAAAASAAAGGTVDPLQWWSALTQQFQHIAQQAVQDVTQHAMQHATNTHEAAASAVQAMGAAATPRKAAARSTRKPAASKSPAPSARKAPASKAKTAASKPKR